MNDLPFHHSLHVIEEKCKGCTHCMKRCPTKAIRIFGGKARIFSDLCIDCGQCMAVCPNDAIEVEQDSFEQLNAYHHRIGIVPAVFFAQFADTYSEGQICSALYESGFTHLYLSETGIDILDKLGAPEIEHNLPLISNFCPSVQRLIQIRFPLLLENLSRVRPPAQMVALFAKAELKGQDDSIGIFYITPCAAKIAQIKTEGSEENSLFQGVINFDTAYNKVRAFLEMHKHQESMGKTATLSFPAVTRKASQWSMVKGQSNAHRGRSLSVDEVHNVIEFLDQMEQENDINLEFLELDACAEGCPGGILTVRNRFLASERLRHWSQTLPKELPPSLIKRITDQSEALAKSLYLDPPQPKGAMELDQDIGKALYKLEKVHQILAVLPGIDCGLCGAPTCRALAEDIAQKKASIRQCVVLKLKDAKELNALAKIWGERPTGASVSKDDQEQGS
ncbi:MAG: [Fe-Fe] hydrogenase large subunit C-terminal domain-containing protein [Sphaerochaeta sp.]